MELSPSPTSVMPVHLIMSPIHQSSLPKRPFPTPPTPLPPFSSSSSNPPSYNFLTPLRAGIAFFARCRRPSLRIILIVVILLCVASCTGAAWAISATMAQRNIASLAENATRFNVQFKRSVITSMLQLFLVHTRMDFNWFCSDATSLGLLSKAELNQRVAHRFIDRFLDSPVRSVAFFATSDDYFVGVYGQMLAGSTSSQEEWILLTANGSTSPLQAQTILPRLDGSYSVLADREMGNSAPYQPTKLPYFIHATVEPKFIPTYYSGSTSIPYIFAMVRYGLPPHREVVIGNGINADGFSEILRLNLTDGRRLYVVERSPSPVAALLAASHGNIQTLNRGQSVPISPTQSTDPIIQKSAMKILESDMCWEHASSYARYWLPGEGEHFVLTETIAQNGLNYVLVEVTPVDVIMREVNRATRDTIMICSFLIVFDVIAVLILSIWLSRPLNRMHQTIVDLSLLKFANLSSRRTNTPIAQLATMETALMRLQNGIMSFAQYVPLELLQFLLAERQRIGSFIESRVVTIIFCDIDGFTSWCDRVNLDTLLLVLNRYFDCVSDAITFYQGTIDKYIGDSVMAMWNAPRAQPGHQRSAMHAVFQMQSDIGKLNEQLRFLIPSPIKLRIGANTDVVMVGSIGSSVRLSYTCIGSGVNVAARLQALNSEVGTRCVVTRNLADEAPDVVFRFIGSVRLFGSAATLPVKVFEPLCRSDEDPTEESLKTQFFGNPLSPAIPRKLLLRPNLTSSSSCEEGGITPSMVFSSDDQRLVLPRQPPERIRKLTGVCSSSPSLPSSSLPPSGTQQDLDPLVLLNGEPVLRTRVVEYAQLHSHIVSLLETRKLSEARVMVEKLIEMMKSLIKTEDEAVRILQKRVLKAMAHTGNGWDTVIVQTLK